MEEIDKLYDVVSKQGLYTKSKDEFISKYSNDTDISKLYDVVSKEGLYTKSKDDFYNKYFESLKKKEPSQQASQLSFQEKVSVLKSPPKSAYDTLVIGQAKPAVASATSIGKPKPATISTTQEEASLRKELASIKVTSENMDLVSSKTDRLSALQKINAKAVREKNAKVDNEITARIFSTNKDAIKQSIASEENDYEMSDYAREGAKNVLNVAGGILNVFPKTINALSGNNLALPSFDKFEKKIPFGEQLKEVDEETAERKKQDPNFNITNEQRLALAKQKFAIKAEKAQHLDNASRILQDENPDVQARIKAKSIKDIKNTSETSKSISAQIQVIDNQATPLRKEIAEMEKTAKSGKYTNEFVLDYNNKLENYNKLVGQYTSLLKDKEKADEGNLTAQERLEVFKLDYNPYTKAVDDIAGGFLKMGGDFLYTMGKLDQKLNEIPGVQEFSDKYSIGKPREDGKNIFMAGADVLLKSAESRQAAHRQIKVSEIDGFGKFGGWVGQTLGAISPFVIGSALGSTELSLASKAFLPMSPALVGFSTAAAGGSMYEMDKEMENTPGLDYSNWQYLAKTAGSVGSNALMFGNYGAIFKGNKALFESIGKTPGANIEFQKGIKDYVESMYKAAKGVNKTGSTMALVSGINMYIDNHVLGKKHEGDFEEIADAWLEGAAMHSVTAELPKALVFVAEKVIPNSTKKEMRSNLSEIHTFKTELTTNENLLPEEATEIKRKIKFIEDKNEKIFRKSLKNSSSFTPKQIAELLKADQEKFAITKEAESVKKGNYSTEYKQKELDRLKGEFNKITVKTNDVFTNKYNAFENLDKKDQDRLNSDAEESLQKELNPSRDKVLKLTPEQIKDKALEIHKIEQVFNGMNIKDIDALKRTAMAEIAQGLTDKQKKDGYKITNEEVVKKVIKDWNQRVADRIAEKEKKEVVDSEPTPTQLTVNEKELEVERLREKERLEKEKVDPNDKEKLDEIYNRYDKLISPLLRDIEGAKAEKIDSEIDSLDDYHKRVLEDEKSYDWEKEQANEYFADKRKYIERTLEISKRSLKEDPDSGFDKRSIELAEKALKELDEQENAKQKEELTAKAEVVPTEKTQGTPDVISEPIDLEVPKPKVEAPKEEAKPIEEKPFEGEGKFTIDGKEYTQEEAIERSRNASYGRIPFGSKMEYTGNNPQAIEFVNDYNKRANPYSNDGKLKDSYIKEQIGKAFDEMSFRKFGDLYRKHIDPYFSRANNEKSAGGRVDKGLTWKELASYVIGDKVASDYTEAGFRAFAEAAGIKVPEFVPTEKAKVAEVVEPKTAEVVEPKKVDTSKIDEEIDYYQQQVDYSNSKIYDIEDEIVNEKGNTKSGLIELREQVKKEIEEVKKDKSLSKDERLDKIEEIKYQIENFKEEQQDLIDSYKDDLQAEKADLKKNQKKLDKFNEQKKALLEQETAPVETKKEQLTKEVDDATKALQKAWNDIKSNKVGFAFDPNKKAEQDLKQQAAVNKALIDYGVAKLKKGAYDFSEFVKDLEKQGIKVSKEFAKDVYERIKSAHAAVSKKESGDRLGIKRTPAEEKAIQAKIDKAYELGAKEQKVISKEIEKALKLEAKETEAQAKDALAAQKEVLGIEKAEALSEQGKKFKEQKESIKQSIKDKIEKSKDAIKNINQIVAESLPLDKLTKVQVKSILNNAMKIFTYANVENGVANFVDHVDKVINNIDHVRNLENLETLRKKSFQNLLKAKVDFSISVTDVVSKVLSIKPEHIPSEVMSDYTRILDKLGDNADKKIQKLISEIPKAKGAELLKKQAELKELKETQIKDRAELIQMANKVMDAFQVNRNKVVELSDSYNSYIENNNLQGETFSKVVKKMEADDIITETEADLMRSNSDYYVKRKAREGKKGEVLEQRESLTERVNQTLQSLNSREGVEYRKNSLDKESILEANKVVGKVTKEYLDSLSDNELETVLNELNALDGGFVTANLRKVANGIELFEREKAITPILSDAKLKWWEGAKSTIKATYYGIKGDKVKSSVWYHKLQGAHNNIIDTVVNNLKNNDLYKNTSDKAAKLWGQSKTYIDINQNKYINPLSNLIEKQAKGDSAEVMKSNIKTSLYLYQKMHNSSMNKGKDIHVEEYVKTANKNKVYSDETLNEINSALEKFKEKDFDVDRWYNEELTDSERKVVDGIRDFYDSDIKEKAKSTSYFDDGRLMDTSNPNYVPVDFAFADNSDVQIDNLIKNKTEAFYNPSMKAGNLMDKAGSSGGINKSLNLTNPFKTMETYLTDVSTQYHMMNEVRVQNQLYKKLLANESFSKSSLELINAMKAGNDKVVSSWLENAYKETGFWGSVFDKRITKQLLSGFGKFAAEGVGNAINMVNHFGEVAEGIKIINDNALSMEQTDSAMYNLGISQAYRFIGKALSIESPFKNQGGVDMPLTRKLKMDSNMPKEYINMMNNLYKRTKTKALLDQIEMLHDALRVTPDKSLSKPLALGIFQKRFQSLSGELPNWEKISSGDAEYMSQNKEFIDVAVSSANVEASLVIGSQNPYEKAGKQLITKDSNVYSKANGFFQGYSMAQGSAFQVALKNLLYNGAISKVEASIMVAQRISSQAAYLTISKGIQKGMLALVGGALGYTLFKDDEEEEGARKRNVVASAVQLAMSRTGAVGSNLAAFAFEKGSEKYGQGVLYEGEYTKGKATMFSAYDPKKTAGENFLNVGLQSMGQRWVTVSKGKEVVTDFAKGEWKTGMFDIAGSLGYIPLYKDVNSVVGGLKYQGLPSKEMAQGMTSAEQIELEEKKVPKALETTFKNLGIAKKRFLNKEISKDEWHAIRDKNKKVFQSLLKLGPIDDSVFENSIDKMVESVGVRSGKYEGIEDFRKMNSNDRKEYLYNIVKDVKKGEKIPQDVKDKVGKIIKAGLVKESEVGDVVRYYQKYK